MENHQLTDADGELAAVVYGPTESPDFVLASFIHAQRARGCDVIGVMQAGRGHTATLVMVPDDQRLSPAAYDPAALPSGRRDFLDGAAASLCRRIGAGADLVVVNRFGRLEAAGRGLWPVILAAHRHERPLLVAVPRSNLDNWLRLSAGMCTALACTRSAIDAWWGSRRPDAVRRQGPVPF